MGQICIHIVRRKTGRIHKHTQYKMSINVIYRWAQSNMKEQFWYWSNRTCYHKSDPVKGWTCWGHNLQVESNSDTPQMPLKGKNTHWFMFGYNIPSTGLYFLFIWKSPLTYARVAAAARFGTGYRAEEDLELGVQQGHIFSPEDLHRRQWSSGATDVNIYRFHNHVLIT